MQSEEDEKKVGGRCWSVEGSRHNGGGDDVQAYKTFYDKM